MVSSAEQIGQKVIDAFNETTKYGIKVNVRKSLPLSLSPL
jgi:hypothetical protein